MLQMRSAMGHRAKECEANRASCLVCRVAGRPDAHRVGTKGCKAPKVGPRAAAVGEGEKLRLVRPKKGQEELELAPPILEKDSAMEVEVQGGRRRKAAPAPESEEETAPSKRRRGEVQAEEGRKEKSLTSDKRKEGAEDAGVSQDIHPLQE